MTDTDADADSYSPSDADILAVHPDYNDVGVTQRAVYLVHTIEVHDYFENMVRAEIIAAQPE